MLVQQRRKWKRFKDITTFLKRSAYRLSLAHWQTASLARIDIIWRRERIMKITQVLGKKIHAYICMHVCYFVWKHFRNMWLFKLCGISGEFETSGFLDHSGYMMSYCIKQITWLVQGLTFSRTRFSTGALWTEWKLQKRRKSYLK